jgi:hypothetical protein
MSFAVSFHAAGDFGEKVTCFEFEEIGIDGSHDGAACSRTSAPTQGWSATDNGQVSLSISYNFPDKLYDFFLPFGFAVAISRP